MNLDCVATLLHVTEEVAKRGYDKFSNSSQSLPRPLLNKIVEKERLGKVFTQKSYRGKNGDAIELFPLKFEGGGDAFLFVPFWSQRPEGRVNFKVFILAANNSGERSVTLAFRFEEPENRGPNHRFWHAQLCRVPLSKSVSDEVTYDIPCYPWLPTTNPAIPLPISGGHIDLLLVMLISVFGYKKPVEDEINACAFGYGLKKSILTRISAIVNMRG